MRFFRYRLYDVIGTDDSTVVFVSAVDNQRCCHGNGGSSALVDNPFLAWNYRVGTAPLFSSHAQMAQIYVLMRDSDIVFSMAFLPSSFDSLRCAPSDLRPLLKTLSIVVFELVSKSVIFLTFSIYQFCRYRAGWITYQSVRISRDAAVLHHVWHAF